MPQYKYKLARKTIKKFKKFKKNVLKLYDENNYIFSETGINILSTSREETIERCDIIFNIMYQILNNPNRFKY
jgi:hypothetical protein